MKKIALPVTSENNVDSHFGHCEKYAVYTITGQREISVIEEIQSEQGCGCKSDIASVLSEYGVTVMLAGGIGNGAVNVLTNYGISVVRGCTGNATEVVKNYLAGNISDNGVNCVQHEHHHEDGHQCSSH
jgi:predicted Fe-Mo cluster-binding NifX family protein